MVNMVHILHAGSALCGFNIGPPAEWQPGHKWTGLGNSEDATCDVCNGVIRMPKWQLIKRNAI